jgi:hypothetical protein
VPLLRCHPRSPSRILVCCLQAKRVRWAGSSTTMGRTDMITAGALARAAAERRARQGTIIRTQHCTRHRLPAPATAALPQAVRRGVGRALAVRAPAAQSTRTAVSPAPQVCTRRASVWLPPWPRSQLRDAAPGADHLCADHLSGLWGCRLPPTTSRRLRCCCVCLCTEAEALSGDVNAALGPPSRCQLSPTRR